MSIRHAILGFLSWKPCTGYELKKLFAETPSFHWSGNNNQIYGSLLDLAKEGALSSEVLQQEKFPAKKVYAITDKGREELKAWLLSEPELPQVRNLAHAQLAWADALSAQELDGVLGTYCAALEAQVLMVREQERRGLTEPRRSERERLLWKAIEENRLGYLEAELAWARKLRAEIGENLQKGGQPLDPVTSGH